MWSEWPSDEGQGRWWVVMGWADNFAGATGWVVFALLRLFFLDSLLLTVKVRQRQTAQWMRQSMLEAKAEGGRPSRPSQSPEPSAPAQSITIA